MSLADEIKTLEEENRQMSELPEKVARGITPGCDTEDVIRITSDVKNFCIAKHQKQDHQELWDIKFVRDGGTTEIAGTYASEEACRQEPAYYRSKPGTGVRYFMEKKNDQ